MADGELARDGGAGSRNRGSSKKTSDIQTKFQRPPRRRRKQRRGPRPTGTRQSCSSATPPLAQRGATAHQFSRPPPHPPAPAPATPPRARPRRASARRARPRRRRRSRSASSSASMTARACSTSSSDGVNSSFNAATCAGWIAHLPSKPMSRARSAAAVKPSSTLIPRYGPSIAAMSCVRAATRTASWIARHESSSAPRAAPPGRATPTGRRSRGSARPGAATRRRSRRAAPRPPRSR